MENRSKNQAFIVDIGETMVNTKNAGGTDKQKLFCTCGSSKKFNYKIKRSILKNFDDLIEIEEGVDSISCSNCKKVYDEYNKPALLAPDKEQIFNITYHIKDSKVGEPNNIKESVKYLYKTSSYVSYDSKKEDLVFRYEHDYIEFDESTKKSSIFLLKSKEGITTKEQINTKLTLDTIEYLNDFFENYTFVQYMGLQKAFDFLKNVNKYVVELDEFKKESFITFAYNNYKIEEIEGENRTELFQIVDSGFGDGKMVKKRVNTGSYLKNLKELSEIYFSILSLSNLSTLYLTKGYAFFKSFITSDFKCTLPVYKKNDATFPAKIIEISTNYNKKGELNCKDGKYLKISPTIYNNIKNPDDISTLYEVYINGVLDKKEIEEIFDKYENEKIFKLLRLVKRLTKSDVTLNFKNIVHILDFGSEDYKMETLQHYIDTKRMIDLLDVDRNEIFKIKNGLDLNTMHDKYTAKYNTIKDKEKNKFYLKAVSEFSHLNKILKEIAFTVIPTVEALNEEGVKMKHCIYSYLERICRKEYLAVNVKHTISNERATMGLIRNNGGLEFEQLKSYTNSRASSEMINTVIDFCNKNGIKCVSSNNRDLSPSESERRRMDDYLSDEEVEKIRKERKKKEKDKK
jgi:hypothetical protein